MKKKKNIIFLILLLAFFLRTVFLDKFPAGFSADEFSQGYTAYSILKTGKDEWGVKFPIAPRAFGDYRSPLYTYLVIPSVAIFGLNEFAVRLPNAIIGTLAVYAIYLLVTELFKKDGYIFEKKNDINFFGVISSLFLAFSPWHISLSRGAFEANLTTLLLPLGIFLFLKGIQNQKLKGSVELLLSSFVFGLNLFSYFAPRFFTPLCVLVLWSAFRKEIFKSKKFLIILLTFVFFMLLSCWTLLAGAKTRVADTSILNQANNWGSLSSRQYEAIYLGFPRNVERLFNNKITYLINLFIKNYLGYFSAEFLFLKGASEWTYGMISGRGVLYLFEIPLIAFSLWYCLKNRQKGLIIVLVLLLLSPIPAALAKGERAANRASTMMPFIQIVSAYGAICLWKFLSGRFSKKLVSFIFFAVYLIFTAFFFEDYFYHAPMASGRYMAFGWREASEYLIQNGDLYKKIIISKNFSEPQIAIAYFLKMDPLTVQRNSPPWLDYQKKGLLFVDQLSDYSLENYEFRSFRFPEDTKLEKTLFVGREEDFVGVEGEVKKVVYYPGPERKIAIKIIDFQ